MYSNLSEVGVADHIGTQGPLTVSNCQDTAMYNVPEQFTATAKSGTDSLLNIANAAFTSLERLSALNMSVAKAAALEGADTWKTLLTVKDSQGLTGLSSIAQPSFEKAVTYSRGNYEIFSETGAAVFKELERHFSEFQKSVAATLDQAIKNAPPGTESAAAALKSAFATASSTYESMTNAAKQATESAHASIAAASDANLKAATKLATASSNQHTKAA